MKTKSEILAFFSEKKISQNTATTITNLLYDKGLDIKALERVMWRIERYVREEKMATIIDLLTSQEIEQVIDEMVAEDAEWATKQINQSEGCKSEIYGEKNFTAW